MFSQSNATATSNTQLFVTSSTIPSFFLQVLSTEPSLCCEVCSGANSYSLFADIAMTQPSACSAFVLQYAINIGWVCKFYQNNATTPVLNGAVSFAYLL